MAATGATQSNSAQAGLGSAKTRQELAALLDVSARKLRFLLYRLPPTRQYRTFDIKKRSGGLRQIRAPALPIKRLQEKVAELLSLA